MESEQSRREAAALRANLRRRKQQTQARTAALHDPAPTTDSPRGSAPET